MFASNNFLKITSCFIVCNVDVEGVEQYCRHVLLKASMDYRYIKNA